MEIQTTPLAVDLDGSLLRTDLLHESLVRVALKKPLVLFLVPIWLLRGIAYLKHQLAEKASIDTEILPYNTALVDYLKEQKASGRTLILCTGSHISLAQKVSDHLGVFDEVIATGQHGQINLTGSNKASLLTERFGERQFSYVGNESRDVPVWKQAKSAIIVSESNSLQKKVSTLCTVEKQLSGRRFSLRACIQEIRIHQWIKNTLLFIPLAASHRIFEASLFISTLLSFISFSLCASATYIINDLADLDADRSHWKKKTRPLAQGSLTIKHGMILCLMMLSASIGIALQLPSLFLLALLVYIGVTISYSYLFKRLQTLDIVVLAGLYALRILAGCAGASIVPSFWLLAFAMFVFICLALVKRISEIMNILEQRKTAGHVKGRGYFVSDLQVLTGLGSASGFASILVISMYINSPDVLALYEAPVILWLVCPVFAYWIIRMQIMAARGEIDEDPISYTMKDSKSWLAGAIVIGTMALANHVTF